MSVKRQTYSTLLLNPNIPPFKGNKQAFQWQKI